MGQKKETKHTRYERKRKRINISLKPVEQQKMRAQYGRLLTSSEIKEILFEGQIVIVTKNSDPNLVELIVQLSKLGNNLNQLARVANQHKQFTPEHFIKLMSMDLRKEIDRIRQIRYDSQNHQS